MLQIKGLISLDVINCTTGDGVGDSESYTGLYTGLQQCVDAVKGGLISESFSFWFWFVQKSKFVINNPIDMSK